jgi:hypothetical protein
VGPALQAVSGSAEGGGVWTETSYGPETTTDNVSVSIGVWF